MNDALRELNVRVAKEVMGWPEWENPEDSDAPEALVRGTVRFFALWGHEVTVYDPVRRPNGDVVFDFAPSSDISAAFQVVEKMREKGWLVSLDNQSGTDWLASFGVFGRAAFHEHASTASEAICRAALHAVGSSQGGEEHKG